MTPTRVAAPWKYSRAMPVIAEGVEANASTAVSISPSFRLLMKLDFQ